MWWNSEERGNKREGMWKTLQTTVQLRLSWAQSTHLHHPKHFGCHQAPSTGKYVSKASKHFTVLRDSMKMFTCLPLCKQLQGLLQRIRERHLPAASAPPWWHCTVPNSAASAKYLHVLLRQELPPVKMKLAEQYSTEVNYCGRTLQRTLKNLQPQ